jgi:hypothetical protein
MHGSSVFSFLERLTQLSWLTAQLSFLTCINCHVVRNLNYEYELQDKT